MESSASREGLGRVTMLLRAWSEGDHGALERLTPIVYDELHRLARRYMRRERSDHTLQTSALVNEAFMRLPDYGRIPWQNRAHFFALAAQLMRRILVDYARRRNSKRGGETVRVPFAEGNMARGGNRVDIVALNDALADLARMDARIAQVVELRFFGGLSAEESAEVLGVSAVTVLRDWRSARARLYLELNGGADGSQTMGKNR